MKKQKPDHENKHPGIMWALFTIMQEAEMAPNSNNLLSCIEIDPAQPAERAIIWLHGLGADGHDFVPMATELQLPPHLNVRYVFPHAPVMPITINNGYKMNAWYDILGFSLDSEVDHGGIQKSVTSIQQLINQETTRGITPQQIILAGFSQGAVITLATALQLDEPLGGVIALSGYLPLMNGNGISANEKTNLQTPFFIAHGLDDPIVPCHLGQMAASTLQQADCEVAWKTYDMPHTVCADEVKDISDWIQTIWR